MSKRGQRRGAKNVVKRRVEALEKVMTKGVDEFARDISNLFDNQMMLAGELDRIDILVTAVAELVSELGITKDKIQQTMAKLRHEKEEAYRQAAAEQAAAQAKASLRERAEKDLTEALGAAPSEEILNIALATGEDDHPTGAFIFGG